jgi:NADH:ubiquinone oxidoreductase subunit
MIPGEWFGWMHYKTDIPPTEVCQQHQITFKKTLEIISLLFSF